MLKFIISLQERWEKRNEGKGRIREKGREREGRSGARGRGGKGTRGGGDKGVREKDEEKSELYLRWAARGG